MKLLIVVDMLRGFLEEGYPLYCGNAAREIIPNILKLGLELREQEIPVLHVRDDHSPNALEFKRFEPHCIQNTEQAETIPELSSLPMTAVLKNTTSGFYKTRLDWWLKYYGCTEAVVVGVCTGICVQHLVTDLMIRDIPVTIYEDCVSGFDKELHAAALAHMGNILGVTVERYYEVEVDTDEEIEEELSLEEDETV